MTATDLPGRPPTLSASASALRAASSFWFGAAVAGQWAFLYDSVVFYGPSTFSGDFQAWARTKCSSKATPQNNPVPVGRLSLAGIIVGLTLVMGVRTIGFIALVRPLFIHA